MTSGSKRERRSRHYRALVGEKTNLVDMRRNSMTNFQGVMYQYIHNPNAERVKKDEFTLNNREIKPGFYIIRGSEMRKLPISEGYGVSIEGRTITLTDEPQIREYTRPKKTKRREYQTRWH